MKIFLPFLFIIFSFCGFSQKDIVVDGEILIQIKRGSNVLNNILKFTDIDAIEKVSDALNIYKIKSTEPRVTSMLRRLSYLRNDVLKIQRNHKIEYRATLPNDPLFGNQWQYINDGSNGGTFDADLDMELAWDITTGGTTYSGEKIVACVIDGGIDTNHVDIRDNLWTNEDEIPNNGIDDDGNGYIDDIFGWDSWNDKGALSSHWHGHPVASIIGAKGNNGIGVTGVNWDIDLMFVIGGGNEADAIKAYDYPLKMKKKYIESGGLEGANIVVTNTSWGVDNLKSENAPLWCAMYDSLGKYGILNVTATTNNNVNVEVAGDIPTTCTSHYIISVNNTNNKGELVSSGYGETSIDLGAPGDGIFTAKPGNGYGEVSSGTSFATPHVAGVVALAHSVPCSNFNDLALSDPAMASLVVKYNILSGVNNEPSLEGKTTSGGTLNANNTLQLLMDNCNNLDSIVDLIKSGLFLDTSATNDTTIEVQKTFSHNLFPNPSTDGSFSITWTGDKSEKYKIEIFSVEGSLLLKKEEYAQTDPMVVKINSKFPVGNYIIKVTLENNQFTRRLSIAP